MIEPETETLLQIYVVAQLRLHGVEVHHSPNEGQHRPQYRAKQYRMGVSSGFPDLIIATATEACPHGAALELKRKGGARPSKEQLAWLNRLTALGLRTAWTRGLEPTLLQLRVWGYLPASGEPLL